MKKTVPDNRESSLLGRILIALVVILSSLLLHSVAYDIWQGETLGIFKQVLAGATTIVLIATFLYVLQQRLKMRKTENFRREKW